MKKYSLPAVGLAIPACLLFICGCQKSGGLPVQEEIANLCSIKRISFQLTQEYSNRDTITFFYDRLGRPDSSTRTYVNTGSPRYLFRYDRRGNLQDFIGAYNNGAAEFWTRFTYSEDNRTVWDTTYSLVDQYKIWPPVGVSALMIPGPVRTYDAEGRLIQTFSPYIPPIVFDDSVYTGQYENITYDARGDAQVGGIPISYDDKINYHRTNKVWMFLDDQYSVNNPFLIDAYNTYELPVKFNFNINEYSSLNRILFDLTYPDVVIDYDCDLPKGPVPGE
jgi:hypothetical protein